MTQKTLVNKMEGRLWWVFLDAKCNFWKRKCSFITYISLYISWLVNPIIYWVLTNVCWSHNANFTKAQTNLNLFLIWQFPSLGLKAMSVIKLSFNLSIGTSTKVFVTIFFHLRMRDLPNNTHTHTLPNTWCYDRSKSYFDCFLVCF